MGSRILIAILFISLAGLLGCSKPATAAPGGFGGQGRGGRVAAVSVAPVTKGTIQSVLTYSGNIQPKAQVNLVPKTSGRIDKLFVDVGDTVKAQDKIAQLEQSAAQVQVQQAEAALAAAQTKLATVKAGSRPENIAAAEANVRNAQAKVDQLTPQASDIDAAKAALAAAEAQSTKADNDLATLKAGPDPDAVKQAQLDVDRTKAALWSAQTYRDGQCNPRNPQYQCQAANASAMAAQVAVQQAQDSLNTLLAGPKPQDIADAQTNADSAKAAVASAKAKLDQLLKGPNSTDLASAQASLDQAKSQLALTRTPYTAEDLKAAQAAVDQAQAALDSAKLALDDTTLVAPFDGIIASRSLSEGAIASTQTPIVSIVSKDVVIQVNVDESRVGLIHAGLPVSITVPAYPNQTFTGTVSVLTPVGDTKAHTFLAEIAPDNSAGKLSSGMFASVQITTDRHDGALLIPNDALIQQGDKQAVFVANNGQAELRTVQVGLSDNNNSEITSGLSAGDQVVVAGQSSLNNGDHIIIAGQGGSQGGQQGAPGQQQRGSSQQRGSGQQYGGAQGGPRTRPTTAATPGATATPDASGQKE